MKKSPSFPTTRWARVVYARDPMHPHARAAVEELCQLYWYPVYCYLRRSGVRHDEAEDLTQGFFLYVCEHRTFEKADPVRGRFRSFVLACLKNYASDDRRKQTAAKRTAA
jgi:DNA-directed RNA polymerase specialized sigma24 family protein